MCASEAFVTDLFGGTLTGGRPRIDVLPVHGEHDGDMELVHGVDAFLRAADSAP